MTLCLSFICSDEPSEFDTDVVGRKFRADAQVHITGDISQPISIARDRANAHDPFAVKVMCAPISSDKVRATAHDILPLAAILLHFHLRLTNGFSRFTYLPLMVW